MAAAPAPSAAAANTTSGLLGVSRRGSRESRGLTSG
jgi:hypothetical protein